MTAPRRIERGLRWPDGDRDYLAVAFGDAEHVKRALVHCRSRRLCVQAGGAVGVWPRVLAPEFENVWSFEPDPANFDCLAANTLGLGNVRLWRAALGDHGGTVGLIRRPGNCGAQRVGEDDEGIPVLRLDDLGPPSLDLLCLDVEGYELRALRGAERLLREHRPVVMFEENGLCEHYGVRSGEAEAWLVARGYRVVDRIRRDIIACAAS